MERRAISGTVGKGRRRRKARQLLVGQRIATVLTRLLLYRVSSGSCAARILLLLGAPRPSSVVLRSPQRQSCKALRIELNDDNKGAAAFNGVRQFSTKRGESGWDRVAMPGPHIQDGAAFRQLRCVPSPPALTQGSPCGQFQRHVGV